MQKKHSVHYAGAVSLIAVIAIGAFVYAQQSFRQQVQDAVVEKVSADVAGQLLAQDSSTEDALIGSGSMAPYKIDLFGTLTEDARRVGVSVGAPTTTVSWYWFATGTDPATKVISIPDNYDQATLFIIAQASTTASELQVFIEESWNGYEWFSLRNATTSGPYVTLQPTTTIQWIPGDTATRTVAFSEKPFDFLRAPHYRFTAKRAKDGTGDANMRIQSFLMFFDNK